MTLVTRELFFLLLLGALGAGPAAFLDGRFTLPARIAFAPVLGLSLGVSVFTSLGWFLPAGRLALAVPILAALSLALCWGRAHRQERRRRREHGEQPARISLVAVVQLALVAFIAFAPLTSVIEANHSIGPTEFQIGDVSGYLAETDAAQIESIQAARHATLPAPNLPQDFFGVYAVGVQEMDIAYLAAATNQFLGLHATDTQSAFLLAILAAGALAMYGALLTELRRSSWAAVCAGAMFSGSFFLELFYDGSQAAICGLGTLIPLIVVARHALLTRARNLLALTALLVAGLAELYPIFLVPLGLATVVILVAYLAWSLRTRQGGLAGEFRFWCPRLALAGAFAIALNVDAFARDYRYLRSLASGGFVSSSLPPYHLDAAAALKWLLGTRSLYQLAFVPQPIARDLLLGLLVPAVALSFIVPVLRRSLFGWFLITFVLVTIASGTYQSVHNSCGYCEDRNLLASVPVLLFLIFWGVGLLALSARTLMRIAAALGASVFLVFDAYTSLKALRYYSANAYYLPNFVRQLVNSIPTDTSVALEGFNAGPNAPAEQPITYDLVFERTGNRVSIPADIDEHGALAYFGTFPLATAMFRPRYSLVLTRMASIRSGRHVIATEGEIALERRAAPLDVLLDGGLLGPLSPERRVSENADVILPLRFIVTGSGLGGPVHVDLGFKVLAGSDIVSSYGGAQFTPFGSSLSVCVNAVGGSRFRVASVRLPPSVAARLVSMKASPGHCRTAVFTSTGHEQFWIAPKDLLGPVKVVVVGGPGAVGAAGNRGFGAGGHGAALSAELDVSPGQRVGVWVGGSGTTPYSMKSPHLGGSTAKEYLDSVGKALNGGVGGDSTYGGGGAGGAASMLASATGNTVYLVAGGGGGGGGSGATACNGTGRTGGMGGSAPGRSGNPGQPGAGGRAAGRPGSGGTAANGGVGGAAVTGATPGAPGASGPVLRSRAQGGGAGGAGPGASPCGNQGGGGGGGGGGLDAGGGGSSGAVGGGGGGGGAGATFVDTAVVKDVRFATQNSASGGEIVLTYQVSGGQ